MTEENLSNTCIFSEGHIIALCLEILHSTSALHLGPFKTVKSPIAQSEKNMTLNRLQNQIPIYSMRADTRTQSIIVTLSHLSSVLGSIKFLLLCSSSVMMMKMLWGLIWGFNVL